MHSYSQELLTEKLQWKTQDSIEIITFKDKDQIIEWSKNQLPFSNTYLEEFLIKGSKIYIDIVSGCSGLSCWNIYVFKECDYNWQLVMSTNARLIEKIEKNIDNNQEKIIFKTKSGQIGELSFKTLNLNFHKSE